VSGAADFLASLVFWWLACWVAGIGAAALLVTWLSPRGED